MKPREFIGTYPCVVCGKRVRVYDWLPNAVLCAKCFRKEEDHGRARDDRREDGAQ